MNLRKPSVRRHHHRLTAACAAAAAGLVAGRQAVADTYTWATPATNSWSVGFTPGTPPPSFATQLVFVPGSYSAYDDLGAGADGFFDLNTITVNNADANTVNLTVNSQAGGTGPAPLLFGGSNSGLFVNGGSVNLGLGFNTADGTQIVNAGGGTLTTTASIGFGTGTTTITNGTAGQSSTGSIVINDATTSGITGLAITGTNVTLNVANYNPNAGSVLIGDMAPVSGTLNVTAGYVKAADTGGDLFGNSLVLNVAAGATFDFNNNGEDFGGLTGAGNVVLGTAGLSFELAGNRAFTGTISGTGGVTQAVPSVFSLGGANTYSGNTTVVAGGTIRATAANAFSPNSLVNLAAGGTLDPGGFSQTIAGLIGGAAADTVPVTAGTLTINPAGTSTYQGSVAGAGNLTVSGTGTEILNGAAGVTGTVNVSSGTLRENFTAVNSAAAVTIGSAGTLDTIVGTNATAGFPLTGSGTLIVEGAGTLSLAATGPTLNLSALTLGGAGLTLAASANGASQVGTPTLTTNGSGTLTVVGRVRGDARPVVQRDDAERVAGADRHGGLGRDDGRRRRRADPPGQRRRHGRLQPDQRRGELHHHGGQQRLDRHDRRVRHLRRHRWAWSAPAGPSARSRPTRPTPSAPRPTPT